MLAVLQGKEKLADQMRQELAGDTRSDHLMLVNAYNVSYKVPCATLYSQFSFICLVNDLNRIDPVTNPLGKMINSLSKYDYNSESYGRIK